MFAKSDKKNQIKEKKEEKKLSGYNKTKENHKILGRFEKGKKLICMNIKSHHVDNIIIIQELEGFLSL